MLAAAAAALCLSGPAWAAPGNPGVPSAPILLYHEDFENGTGVTNLPAYVSDTGIQYTADVPWLSTADCNGFIASYPTPRPAGYCSALSQWDLAVRKINALGLLNSPQNPMTNRALSTNTTGNVSTQGLVMFRTVQQVPLSTASGRFVTFSVDAAATACNLIQPLLRFYLDDNGTAAGGETPVSNAAINPCTDPRRQSVMVDGSEVRYGSFPADSSILFTGASMGVVLRNDAGGTGSQGNDGAIDNIRILDVTPQLDKAFVPVLTATGQPSRLTFTVTNTSELAAKPGFSFTDNLPAGMTIASTPDFQSTCAPASITAGGTAGATSVSFQGSLAAGQVSCTFSINVSAAAEGTFTNAPGTNVINPVGLNPPAEATLTVRNARLTLNKAIAAPGRFNAATDQFTMEIRQDTATGNVVNATAASTTTGSGTTVNGGSGTTGATVLAAGTTYHLMEAAAGTTDLAAYLRTITCTDAASLQTGLPANQPLGTSFPIVPVAGASIACTITNTPNRGQITIVKNAVPQDPQDFAFTTSGAGLSNFSLDDDGDPALPNSQTFPALVPGSYTVSESALAGWRLTALSCSGDTDGGTTVNLAAGTATIDLDANEHITCTFTNTKAASLQLRKQWVNAALNDAVNIPATSGFTANTTPLVSVADAATDTDTGVAVNVFPGDVGTLPAEQFTTGTASHYTSTLACTGGGTLSGSDATVANTLTIQPADAGATIVCTYINARPLADLQVVKTASPAGAVQSGQTVVYTITATNHGPGAANGAQIHDGPVSGLSCPRPSTTPSCVATGGAVCPASLAGLFTAPGVTVSTLPAGGALTLTVECLVD